MTSRAPRTLSPLPPTLVEIRRVIGFEAMLCLASVRGGESIYVPARIDPTHWLAQTIGFELATKLAEHFATNSAGKQFGRGASIALPMLPKELRVRHLTNQGFSVNSIARALGLHSRTVRWHQKLHREADANHV